MWKDIVRKLAPTLGAALGGPMGGIAVKFIADNLLGNPDATQDDIEAAIAGASPEQLARLREIDAQFKVEMKKLDINVFELETKDRQSARDLFKVNIWPQISLSAIYIIGYFMVLYVTMTGKLALTDDVKPLVNVLIGVLTGAVPMILQFWFGSSLGSKEKTQAMRS